jgi:hypothetical protein
MSRRAATWTWTLLLALVLASCGAESGASRDAPRVSKRTTATTAPSTTSTTVPPPYSFDGSVPPPKLINTGTDYAAIVKSLDDYAHWLYAHNPNSVLASEIALVGTDAYSTLADDLADLTSQDMRIYDTASVLQTVEVVSTLANAASLRIGYTDKNKVLVNSHGNLVDTKQLSPRSEFLVLLAADSTGRWRIASSEPASSDSSQ